MEYSAVIRSLGNLEYLNPTISSLMRQSIKPSEIVLVIPENIDSPQVVKAEPLIIYRSPKGMIKQRKTGILKAKFNYLLLIDDDIVFERNDAVQNLLTSLEKYNAKCVLPYASDAYPKGIIRILLNSFFGISIPTQKYHLKYTCGGGFYYPKNPPQDKPFLIEGGGGICIAVEKSFLIQNNIFGDEDLERIPYPLREDGAFVYDIVIHDGKAIMIPNVPFNHIGVSHRTSNKRLYWSNVASIYNNFIFWKKYIYTTCQIKPWAILCFSWHLVGISFYAFLKGIKDKSLYPLKGIKDGFKRVFSEMGR